VIGVSRRKKCQLRILLGCRGPTDATHVVQKKGGNREASGKTGEEGGRGHSPTGVRLRDCVTKEHPDVVKSGAHKMEGLKRNRYPQKKKKEGPESKKSSVLRMCIRTLIVT